MIHYSPSMLLFLALGAVVATANIPSGCETAGCDAMVPLENGWPDLYSLRDGFFPGQTLCIPYGHHWGLSLKNLRGLPGQPVTIRNCGGIATFDGQKDHPVTNETRSGKPISIRNCTHIRLTGQHLDSHDQYGIIAENGFHGIDATDGSSNIEIDHVISRNHGYAGIAVRTYPACGGLYTRSTFTQFDTNIHHNIIEHVEGEGMYIGTSHYQLDEGGYVYGNECPGETASEASLIGVNIHQNVVRDIQMDAIQIGGAIHNVEVHHNTIQRFALKHQYGHSNGIGMNSGSTGNIYDNWIEGPPTRGAEPAVAIAFYGQGADNEVSDIYHNIIQNIDMAFAFYNREDAVNQSYVFAHNLVYNFTSSSPTKVYCLGTSPEFPQPGPVEVTIDNNIFAAGTNAVVLEAPSSDNGWSGWKSFYGNGNGIPGDPSITCLDYVSTQDNNVWVLESEDVEDSLEQYNVNADVTSSSSPLWWHPGLDYEGSFYYCSAKVATESNCMVGLTQQHHPHAGGRKNLLALLLPPQVNATTTLDPRTSAPISAAPISMAPISPAPISPAPISPAPVV